MRSLRLLILLSLLAVPGWASAQDGTDWELHRDGPQRLVAAYLPTTTGLAILVRCQGDALTTYVAGLPQDKREMRTIAAAFGEDALYDRRWISGSEGTSAFTDLPAPFARRLREGGRLQLRVPGAAEGGRAIRYVLDLPPSSAAIDETLTACDRPLVDPRDAELEAVGDNGLPSQLEWARQPRISFPETRYARGFAVVSCISHTDGTARDCVVETEHPYDAGFGAAALRGMRHARLSNRLNPDQPIPASRFTFHVPFIVRGYETAEDRERIDEADRERRERQATD